MVTGISAGAVEAVLARWADHSVATEQILDGWDLEGVHGGILADWGSPAAGHEQQKTD